MGCGEVFERPVATLGINGIVAVNTAVARQWGRIVYLSLLEHPFDIRSQSLGNGLYPATAWEQPLLAGHMVACRCSKSPLLFTT